MCSSIKKLNFLWELWLTAPEPILNDLDYTRTLVCLVITFKDIWLKREALPKNILKISATSQWDTNHVQFRSDKLFIESLHNVLKVFPGFTGREFSILSNITLNLKTWKKVFIVLLDNKQTAFTHLNGCKQFNWTQEIIRKGKNPAQCCRLQEIQYLLRLLSHNLFFFFSWNK